jgi:UDPglucose--hexose-1-phosphate uridylyltransferase
MGEWVAMASHRQARTYQPPTDQCPLCPSRDGRPSEIPTPDYDVVVFENRFPSFAEDVEPVAGTGPGGLSQAHPAHGRCEVVCFTSEHDSSFARLEPARARLVIDAWADRTEALSCVPKVEHVYVFENRGEEIGVTLAHPHGQIYAYPFVPPRAARQLEVATDYRERTGSSLFADVLAAEREAAVRVVASGAHWTAFVPAAARWPMEVHLYPHRQVPDLPALTADERDNLAVVYLDVLRRLDKLYDSPLPYIASWQQAPVRRDRDLAHLHLEVFSIRRSADKLKFLAGSESGMGAFVNDVLPEQAAQRLRDVAVEVPLAPVAGSGR